MYLKYSFSLLLLFNLSMLSASEQPDKKNPICPLDLFNLKQLIVEAKKISRVRLDSHHFSLEDGSVIEHVDFLNDDATKLVNSYTLLVRYKNKKYGIVDSTRVLNLSSEQLRTLRSFYSQLYPVE